jgi:hypothetical protein
VVKVPLIANLQNISGNQVKRDEDTYLFIDSYNNCFILQWASKDTGSKED